VFLFSQALETPEEKRARRLAKKEAKDRNRREKMGWDKEYMGLVSVFFCGDILVICLTVVLKLAVTVFISLYFQTFRPK